MISMLLGVIGMLIIAVVGIVALRDLSDRHHAEVARWETLVTAERARVDNLIAQMQANAQGMVAATWIPPQPPEPEHRYLRDDTGLIEFEDDEFSEVAGV